MTQAQAYHQRGGGKAKAVRCAGASLAGLHKEGAGVDHSLHCVRLLGRCSPSITSGGLHIPCTLGINVNLLYLFR